MVTKFFMKDKKVIPMSIRKMSDAQLEKIAREGNAKLNRIEENQGSAFILKNKKLNALAEKVAQVQVTRKNRVIEKINRENKEADKEFAKDPDVKAFKKLQKNPNFHINNEHTIGWIDRKINFPNYSEGTAFAQHGQDGSGKDSTWRFGHEGEGGFKFSRLGEGMLREVLDDARKNKLVPPLLSLSQMLGQAKVRTSSKPHKSVILEIGKRNYLIAPIIKDE